MKQLLGLSVALLLVNACTPIDTVSNTPAEYDFGESTNDLISPRDEQVATYVVMSFFEENIGDEFSPYVIPVVEWVSGVDCVWDDGGITPGAIISPDGLCYAGIMWTCSEIFVVATEDNHTISDTAFAHELLHCYFAITRGDAGGAHAEPEWGFLLEDTKQLLQTWGL